MADEKNLENNENEDLEEYEPQIVELDGEQFEVIDAVCYDGQNYVALVPYTEVGEVFIEHLGTVFGDEHDDECDCEDCEH